MTRETAIKFLNDNKEALYELSKKIELAQRVENIGTLDELNGVKKAKEIINGWIAYIWNISLEDLPAYEDEDSIYKSVNNLR